MAGFIERTALMERFAEVVAPSNNSDFQKPPTWNDAVEIVENFPSADVKPVVRGRWIKLYKNPLDGNFFCSNCKEVIDIADGEDTPLKRGLYYCHNCGADMREGVE